MVQLECRDPSLRAPVPGGPRSRGPRDAPRAADEPASPPQVAGAEFVGDREEKGLILAVEKGFEPLVGLPPTAVLKTEWKRRRDGHLRRDGTILGPRARIA